VVKPPTPVSAVPGSVKPIPSAATTRPVEPLTPAPPKPSATTVISESPEASKKSGTSVIKAQPPKETARITVKPTLPGVAGAPRPGAPGATLPAVKPGAALAAAAGAGAAIGAGAAAAAAAKPKTVTAAIKPNFPTTPTAAATPAPAPVKSAAPSAISFEEPEEGSPLMTGTAIALAVLTWVAAFVLIAGAEGWI
jgi:hypothetical protein